MKMKSTLHRDMGVKVSEVMHEFALGFALAAYEGLE